MSTQHSRVPAPEEQAGFWSYRRFKELDFFPTGVLRWWLLVMIVWIYCVEQFERLKTGSVLVYIFQEFKVGLPEWGMVGLLAAGAAAVGAYAGSGIAERYGRRVLVVYPVLAYSFISMGTALSTNFTMMAVLYILGGFVISGAGPATNAAIRDISPQVGRGTAYAVLSMGITGGALLSTTTAALTLPIWPGWRPQFYLATVVGLITLILGVAFYRDITRRVRSQIVKDRMSSLELAASPADSPPLDAIAEGKKVYKDWRLWLVCTGAGFWAVAYTGVANYVPTFLIQYHGIAPGTASSLTSIFWVTFTVSVFVSGWLSDKLRVRKLVTIVGAVSTALGFFAMASLPKGTTMDTIGLIWAILGFCSGFIYPAYAAMISEHAESITPFGVARAFGLMSMVAQFGTVALNLGVPFVVARWGWPTWIAVSGASCLLIGVATSFGRSPWLRSSVVQVATAIGSD